MGQGEIEDPHEVEGILAPLEEFDDPEVTFVCIGPPNDDNEGDDDATSDSENGNRNPV